MFRNSSKLVSRLAIASGVVALMFTTASMAQATANGLGQSWPNATDVSVSPHYHVYVFVRDGIRYIQVNDANGTVRGAVATAGNQTLVLPVGVDASTVQVSQDTTQNAVAAAATTETVYSDSATQVTATPQSNGTVALSVVTSNASTPVEGQCQDPQACSHGTVAH
jgi:hypothetical protein